MLSSSDDCPFCRIGPERIAFSWSHGHAIWDGFPVSPGHLLLIPHRHAATWDDLTVEEKVALTVAIDQAMAVVRARHTPNGFNVGFNLGAAAGQTVFHFHLHVIPRYSGDVADPRGGVRTVIPSKGNYLALATPERTRLIAAPHDRALITGGEDAFIRHLLPHIDDSQSIDLVVSFILDSGVRLLQPRLQDLLDRGGRLRVVTGDYLDVTEPSALRRLLDLEGNVKHWVFEGMVLVGNDLVLLMTLAKGDLFSGNEYDDRFIDSQTFKWHTQSRTTQKSKHGRIIRGELTGYQMHLFVRPTKLRDSTAAPFIYCGKISSVEWHDEKPIAVTSRLETQIPKRLHRILKIGVLPTPPR